jgi:sensor histidine kinase YesM
MGMSGKILSRLELRSIAFFFLLFCSGMQALVIVHEGMDTVLASELTLLSFFSALPFFYLLDFSQDFLSGVFSKLSSRVFLLLACVVLAFSTNYILIRIFFPNQQKTTDHLLLTAFVIVVQGMMVSVLSWTWTLVKGLKRDKAYRQAIEGSLREAELHHLRRQLQPHFLFNSLNSVKALLLKDTQAAGTMLENLSEFLRSSLNQDENRPVPFEDELRLLELYLNIEKVRFADRLHVKYDISEEARNCSLPALVLQPAMENAVKFGLSSEEQSVRLQMKAYCMDGGLHVELQNPCDETSGITGKGKGFGLELLRRRLQLLYKRSDLLQTKQERGIFTATIFIPQ